ncbi:MAG TPA: PilZ domain-containing protein [Candidatus Eisenbacteria bacterium]|nr:PilZ domain-containing protein [Candidatus Eisenbacteria bacterium]
MAAVYVYPFRCQLCGHRFTAFRFGVRYLRVEHERREYDRVAVGFPVTILWQNTTITATVTQLSLAGCTVVTDAAFEPGMIMSLSLQFSGEDLPIVVEAAVLRHSDRGSAGFEFLQFVENDRERLRALMHALLSSRKEVRITRPAVNETEAVVALAGQRL